MSRRDAIVAAAKMMPSLPAASALVVSLAQQDDVDPKALADAIKFDPQLTAHVLRLANSARFGGTVEAATIKDAIMRIGSMQALALALGTQVSSLVGGKTEGYRLETGALGDRCVALALAAEAAAKAAGIGADLAFTAGLLSEVGKAALGPWIAEYEHELQQHLELQQVSFDVIEREILEIDHAELGALMLEEWGLPEALVAAVRWHHQPEECPEEHRIIAQVVHVGDMLVSMTGVGTGVDGMLYSIDKKAAKAIGLKGTPAEALLATVIDELDETREVLGLGSE